MIGGGWPSDQHNTVLTTAAQLQPILVRFQKASRRGSGSQCLPLAPKFLGSRTFVLLYPLGPSLSLNHNRRRFHHQKLFSFVKEALLSLMDPLNGHSIPFMSRRSFQQWNQRYVTNSLLNRAKEARIIFDTFFSLKTINKLKQTVIGFWFTSPRATTSCFLLYVPIYNISQELTFLLHLSVKNLQKPQNQSLENQLH